MASYFVRLMIVVDLLDDLLTISVDSFYKLSNYIRLYV